MRRSGRDGVDARPLAVLVAHPVADRVLDAQGGEVEALQRAALRGAVDAQRLARRDPVRPGDAVGERVEVVLVAVRRLRPTSISTRCASRLSRLSTITSCGSPARATPPRARPHRRRRAAGARTSSASSASTPAAHGRKRGRGIGGSGKRSKSGRAAGAAVNSGARRDVESRTAAASRHREEAALAHSTKKLAVSLVALLATLALFATLSAAAQGVADSCCADYQSGDRRRPPTCASPARRSATARGTALSEAEFIRMSREPGTSSSTRAARRGSTSCTSTARSTSAFPTSRSSRWRRRCPTRTRAS